MCRYVITAIFTILIVASLLVNCSNENDESADTILRSDSIHLLLEIMRMVRDRNPDATGWNERLQSLDQPQRQVLLDSLSMRNESDLELKAKIDSLLASDAYQLYYHKFGNVKPEDHRQMLLRLPFGWLPSPADISANLYEVCLHQDSVAAWIETVLGRIDLDAVKRTALVWLPDGNYAMPPTHFILDGNGDAFATRGEVVFDLYSLVLNERPRSTRYTDLANASVDQIEAVLAHEFHHIFANPFYKKATRKSDNAAIIWRQRLTRAMVSEGIAMHCNPPSGLRRLTKEDTTIVAHWFRELSQTLGRLDQAGVNHDEISQWYRASSQGSARKLLRDYLARSLEGEALNREVVLQAHARPAMVYTLGWWMVSRISRYGTDREAVVELLRNPHTLFARYNAVVSDAPDSLRAPD